MKFVKLAGFKFSSINLIMAKPDKSEYADFYKPYMEIIPDDGSDLIQQLESSHAECKLMLKDLGEDKEDYRYAECKWSIKELVQHLIDSERVFAYRALRFSRGDQKELPGFDENLYVQNCQAGERSLPFLLEEFDLMRRSNILMFSSMSEDVLRRDGFVDGNRLSVRALGFICCGHLLHHLKVIQERYL